MTQTSTVLGSEALSTGGALDCTVTSTVTDT